MLQKQLPNGMIPEEIFWSDRSASQNAELLLTWTTDENTDITQMPVLPFSLRAIYNVTKDPELIKEFLPPLVNYFKWWRANRDQGDGLVTAINNFETGLGVYV